MINETPRVRFAPSPTGYLHVGGLRTALYNYLFAKKNNGSFILRIEDTDRNRYVEGAVENLIESLRWSGLEFDEGPGKEGDVGPYMQSERLDIYKKYAEELIAEKKAYYCFCSPERLQKVRDEQQKEKKQPKYDKHCLSLSDEEVQAKIAAGEKHVVRLNVPVDEHVKFNDVVRGAVDFSTEVIDDQILIKTDGYPTYHMANVVDDHLMKVTHVIRGEEWLSSTPKHVLLYQYLGWELPVFAHLPLLLNPDKSKLSKRQGDVAVEDYRAKGYLPEALVNFVALLGWNAGNDQEFYTMKELEDQFGLEQVNKAGAVFNVEKLNWLNQQHLMKKPNEELLVQLKEELKNSDFDENDVCDEYLLQVIEAMKERVSFVKEFLTNGSYFFVQPTEFDEKARKKAWNEDSKENIRILSERFEGLEDPKKEDFEQVLRDLAKEKEVGAGKLIHPLRLVLSGVSGGPGMFDLVAILGKEESVKRMKYALENLE